MSSETYRQSLAEAKAAYELAKQRVIDAQTELDVARLELSDLRRVIAALSIMCGENADPEMIGLTETVRLVTESASYPMTLAEVSIKVAEYGFDWGTQQNPDASLSAILRRLRDAKQIKHRVITVTDRKGRKRKQAVWIGPNTISDRPKEEFLASLRKGKK